MSETSTPCSHLKAHINTYAGENPYNCEKSFGQGGKMQPHLRAYTGVSEYKCELCQKLFALHSRKKCGIKIPHLMWMVIYAHPLCTYILLNVYVLCIRNFLHKKVWMFLAG